MPIEEISSVMQAGSALGAGITPAGYLQLYLAYAKAVSAGDNERKTYLLDLLKHRTAPAKSMGEPESPLEEEVRAVLEKSGYKIHSQVGESGFRIDLAVLHDEPERGYMLGIECDGATYHSDRTARIRDVWREKILTNRGWRLHRIWSTRWWYHRSEEVEKLDLALSEAAEHQNPSSTSSETKPDVPAGDDRTGKTGNPLRVAF
jgi:very-short-patch-repair endonuclease